MAVSTFVHNLFHGIVLYGVFSVNISFGIIITIAILTHSIPQNMATYLLAN
jgi:zinc transporter ZupT